LLDLRAANGSFDWHWYVAPVAMGREMLAIALTAIATEKQVNCSIDDPSVGGSEVLAMQVIK
jgi:hypothetical protein